MHEANPPLGLIEKSCIKVDGPIHHLNWWTGIYQGGNLIYWDLWWRDNALYFTFLVFSLFCSAGGKSLVAPTHPMPWFDWELSIRASPDLIPHSKVEPRLLLRPMDLGINLDIHGHPPFQIGLNFSSIQITFLISF